MKRATPLLLALMVFTAFVSGGASELSYVPGQVIVKFRPQAAAQSAHVLGSLGYEESPVEAPEEFMVVEPREGQSVEAAVAELSSRGDVEFAQPNYIYYGLSIIPNDPSFSDQTWLADIRAPEAWEIDTGVLSDTVGVVDSGADTDAVDLAGKLILFQGIDVIDGDSDPTDGGGSGHGTKTAGVIGAATNNATLVSGINWNGRLQPIRVLTGALAVGTSLTVDSGIRVAIANGARVINLSLGFSDASVDNVIEASITTAVNAGIIVVAAAGNEGEKVSPVVVYPASSTRTIAVGSEENGQRASFSSYVVTTGLNGVDVVAPGKNLTLLAMSDTVTTGSGTSFSAPFVSAAASMVRGRRPGLTPTEFLHYVRSTAIDIGDAGFDIHTGAGRMDLKRLLSVTAASPSYAGATFLTPDSASASATTGGRQAHQSLPISGTDSFAGYGYRTGAVEGTILFYFKPDSSQPTADTLFLLTQKGNGGHNSGNLDLILRSDNKIEYRMADSGTLISSTALNPSQWYHIALSWGSRGMTLYVNGESEAASAYYTGAPPRADTLYLGAPYSFGNAESARGRFDALWFYDTQGLLFPSALTAKCEYPSSNFSTADTFNVSWKAFATESNTLTIDIFADTDQSGCNGILLASGKTNTDQLAELSVSSLTIGQNYYICVVANDATTTGNQFPERAYAYSAGLLTVGPPATVTVGTNAGAAGGPCLLSRLPFGVPSLRIFRDHLIHSTPGRWLSRLYYRLFS